MASIQARHARGCALGRPWTTFDVVALEGCTCPKGPLYHVVSRDDGGKLKREPLGHNRQVAERTLRKVQVQIDEGAYEPLKNIRFGAWADRWLAALQRKETTVNSYRGTVKYAKDVFGNVEVRKLRPAHIARMDKLMRDRTDEKGEPRPLSASSRAKHLRVLHACIASAIAYGYAAEPNPVSMLPKAERPRATRKESAYFEDAELSQLVAAIPEGVYRLLVVAAVKTGMRSGELLALTWADCDLLQAVIRVRRSYTDRILGVPKSHEKRDVDLTTDVVEALGAWWGALGKPGPQTLVFPGGEGYLDGGTVLDVLYAAMGRAGIDRVGPTGEKRTFHSLRHTFARIALEHGAELTWLSRHLGHSGTQITDQVYGHWSRASRKAAMEKLDGAFSV
jgi:integrase